MNISTRIGVGSLMLAIFCIAFLRSVPVDAAQTPCYSFNATSASTVSVNLLTTDGVSHPISIPNQTTPSILQPIDFQAANSTCGLWFTLTYGAPKLSLNFQTPASSFPVKGSPFTMQFPLSATVKDWTTSTYGFLWNIEYHGPADIGSAANEDALIANIDSSQQLTLNTGDSACNATGCSETIWFYPNIYLPPVTPSLTINSGSGLNLPFSVSTLSKGPLSMSASATNCAALSGSGSKKVVFMRSKTDGPASVADFIVQSLAFRDQMLSQKPYSANPAAYSFYADLKKQPSNPYDWTSGGAVSSCGKGAAEYRNIVLPPHVIGITPAESVDANNSDGHIDINGSGFSPSGHDSIQLLSATTSAPLYYVGVLASTTNGAIQNDTLNLYPGFSFALDMNGNSVDIPDGNYLLRVAASNSVWSNAIPITVDSAPNPPTNLVATAKKKGEIELSWTEGKPAGSLSTYIVEALVGGSYIAINGNGEVPSTFQDATTTLIDQPPAESVQFRVKARYDDSRPDSVYTNSASVTTKPKTAAPLLTATAGPNSSILLSWLNLDPSDIKEYLLTNQGTGAEVSADLENTFSIPNAVSGTEYCFAVVAVVNDKNKSDSSNIACATADSGIQEGSLSSSDSASAVAGIDTISFPSTDSTIASIDLVVNGVRVGTDTSAPWNFTFNSGNFPNGPGQIYAIVHRPSQPPVASAPLPIAINNPGGGSVSGGTASTPTISLSASPISISPGGTSNVTWTSTNATSCTILKNGSSWQTGKSGSNLSSGALTANTTFSGSCTGTGGTSAAQSVTVSVRAVVSAPSAGTSSVAPTYSCIAGYTLNGSSCTDTTGSYSCPTGYVSQSGNTCYWPAIQSESWDVNPSNVTVYADQFYSPRFNFGNGDVLPFNDNTTATKWCQNVSVPGKTYTYGQTHVGGANPQDGIHNEFDGSKWNQHGSGDYPRYYQCYGGGVPGTNVSVSIPATLGYASSTSAVATCPASFVFSGSNCYSKTVPTAPTIRIVAIATSSISLVLGLPYNPGIAYYSISTNGGFVATTSAATYFDKNLTPNTQYCFTANAFKSPSYAGDTSASVCAITKALATSTNSTIPATVTYTCPNGGFLSGTNCLAVASSTPLAPMVKYQCPNGLTLTGFTCLAASTAATVPPTTAYSCPSGASLSGTNCVSTIAADVVARCSSPFQTLNQSKTLCTVSRSATSSPIVRYLCPAGSAPGSTISGTNCITPIGPATASISCPTGYMQAGTVCRSMATASSTKATPSYSCVSPYILNPTTNLCYPASTATTPAIPTYVCPTGYALNATTHTCARPVAMGAINTTASVGAAGNFTVSAMLWSWFGIAREAVLKAFGIKG